MRPGIAWRRLARSDRTFPPLAGLWALAALAADAALPLGVAAGLLQVGTILLAAGSRRPRWVVAAAGVAVAFVGLGAALSPTREATAWTVAVNRGLSAAAVVALAAYRLRGLDAERLRRRARGDRRFLAAIVDSTDDAVIGQDLEGRVRSWNPAAARLYGWCAEEALGRHVEDLVVPPERRDEYRELLARLRAGKREHLETVQVTRSGRRVDVSLTLSPVTDEDGALLGGSAITRDIGERKRAEQRLRVAVEASSDAMVIVGEDGRIVFANSATAALLGYTPEELRDRPVEVLVPERHRADHPALRERFLEEPEARPMGAGRDLYALHRDGSEIPVEIGLTPFEMAEGTMVLASIVDIRPRLRQDEERRRFEGKLRETQRLESLGLLAGGIAHDFNNMLVAVLGGAALAQAELPPGSSARRLLEEVEQAARRASDLCRRLLAYSGRGRFTVERVDLSRLVSEMTELLRVSISKRVELRLDLASDLPPVEADPTQLRQVVMNLLTNASESVGEEGGVVRVATGTRVCDAATLRACVLDASEGPGRYAFLEVADTGSGMDAATLQSIFEPFFSTKGAGRGLGLAGVLGIVRGHRGAVQVESQPGRGTTFRVLLPAAQGERATAPEPTPRTALARRQAGGVVLVVEDEPAVRAVAQAALEAAGFGVVAAEDGRAALAAARERGEEIAAVLLDMSMPRMSGEETFRALRELRPELPVVLTSGYEAGDAVGRLSGDGAVRFVQKPWHPSELVAAVRAVLDPDADA